MIGSQAKACNLNPTSDMGYTNAEVRQIADTAFQHLAQAPTIQRATGQLSAMLGSKHFTYGQKDENGNVFAQLDFKGCRKANTCQVELDRASDTYTLRFYKLNRKTYQCPEVKTMEGLYAEDLRRFFESFTGLYVKL